MDTTMLPLHIDITDQWVYPAGKDYLGRKVTAGSFSWGIGTDMYATCGGLVVANVVIGNEQRTIMCENIRENIETLEAAAIRYNPYASGYVDPDSFRARVIGGSRDDIFIGGNKAVPEFIHAVQLKNKQRLKSGFGSIYMPPVSTIARPSEEDLLQA